MAGLAPGDPQLVSMIVNHLKTQGLFDQFRRDCLADVDTKPAYLNLKQRVDNFVSNHLSNHTWSPHLNKNQLRNNIRQLVLQSGMLEQGVDRIVAQVVDPKINHIFRPQVERVVKEFLSPGSCSEEPPLPLAPAEMKPDGIILEQASSSTPATSSSRSAMSILDTITSLNQEASSRAIPSGDRGRKGQASEELTGLFVEEGEQDMSLTDVDSDEKMPDEAEEANLASEFQVLDVKVEEAQEQMVSAKEGLTEEVQVVKVEEETSGGQELVDDAKDKAGSKNSGKHTEDRLEDEPLKPSCQIKQKTRERLKEEYSLEDSDLDGLSDITVSSVHTSDLSSFEEESDEDQPPSDSSEDGELLSDAEEGERKQGSADTEDDKEGKPRRKAYVHKPFLYSRYYSDSDDEVTVEERRRSAAKDKEERLLKRQQNRERWEEKRRQKAALAEEQDARRRLRDSPSLEGPRAKEARKERKVLEKKMALKRKLDSRKEGIVSSKSKGDAGGESSKKGEVKPSSSKASQAKPVRRTSESVLSDERHRKSGSISEDSSEPKKLPDKSRTHSFILELEQGSQESLKHRSFGKFDRLPRKELHSKERKERERSLSDDRTKLKPKMEKRVESQADETQQKEGISVKVTSDEKGEKRPKVKSEKKMLGTTREARVSEGVADEGALRDATSKKSKTPAVDAAKAEKDKEKDKDKDKLRDKDKEKVKEKNKGEKTVLGKSEAKQLIRPDSAGSSEDRSDMEPGPDSSKKKEKHPKEVVKKVKGHTDDKQVEKPKSKSDTKDGEREKTKAELESQKLSKASSETEKDPRKSKPTEKGKAVEKSKLKSKEEVKTAKTDKKIQSLEGKGKGVSTVVKHEQQTKEKKKEASAKEQRRTPEDTPQDKLERSAKKRLEKKDTISEKKEESLEEKKADKTDKSERSLTPSVSSPCPESEEPPKKRALLQDTSTDSEPTATTIVTSVSEDTYDALSDITPEPDDGEAELRLGELETRPMPPEADALLTLMDICTSADARLVHDVCQEEVAAPEVMAPELTLIDVDMKMKEAALTLLSMDPDSTLSPSLIAADSREDGEVNPPPPMDSTTTLEKEPNVTEIVQTVAENDQRTTTLPPALSQEVDKPVTEKTDSTDAPDVVERETDVPQDDKTTSNEQQAQLAEEKVVESETVPEVQPVEELADVQDSLISESEETKDRKIEAIVSDPLPVEQTADTSCRHDEIQSNVAAVKTATKVEKMEDESNQAKKDAEDEDNQAKIDVDNINKDHNVTQLEENVAQENKDPQNVECDAPDNSVEVRETRRSRQTKLIKQTSSASDSDRQEDEKGSDLSEKEGRAEGRVTRKRKLPSTSKNSGEDGDKKESQEEPSAEETEQEKVAEAKTPRRGRSSKTTTDEEEQLGGQSSKPTTEEEVQPKETEMSEEMPTRRGRRSGAQAKDTTDSQQSPLVSQPQPGDEEEQSTENKTDHVEGDEQPQEEQETAQKKPGRRGRPSKGAAGVATEDPADTKDKEKEQNDEEEDDDTKSRTTRSAARLEAERNKPSKPSTRASKQGSKEESTRGARGQTAAAKGGRKREPSPPAVRTRGGQKSDEPPAKRANR